MTRPRPLLASIAAGVLALWGAVTLIAAPAQDIQRQRQRFTEAYEAALNGYTARAESLAESLRGYILYPYLEYALVKGRLDEVSNERVLAFLQEFQEYPFTARLKSAWLERLAENEAWETLLKYYDGGGDRELQCQVLQAKLATGATADLAAEAIELWRVGYSQHEACDPVFAWLYAQDQVSEALRFERMALALDAGNLSLAAYLAEGLSGDLHRWYERWRAMVRNPKETLKASTAWPDTTIARDIVADGLRRIGAYKESGGEAWALWETVSAHFDFSAAQRGALMRALALDAATDYHADSLAMLAAVPESAVNASVRAWRVRVPLMRRDWPQVRKAIAALPDWERDEKVWRYWWARALEATGKSATAKLIYQQLAQDVSYYGFLAADRIGAPYAIEAQALRASDAALHRLAEKPAMARALELFHVGLTVFARQAWARALDGADQQTLIRAALLADRHGWHDRTIFTLADLALWDAYKLRFPLAFRSEVLTLAQQRGLDPSWLYGIIRSESLFMTDAHSGAGAYGLMQLMPATGKLQSQALGLDWDGAYGLMEAAYNLKLGSAYLAKLLKRYSGNTLLASAAYNAGPNEVDQWVKQNSPQYAAIWIDTIPFYETRAYLKRVFAFSVMYDWQLGNGITRLSMRINPTSADRSVAGTQP